MFFYSYLGDGRFHLESIMISNPDIPAYRYCGTKWHQLVVKYFNFSVIYIPTSSPKRSLWSISITALMYSHDLGAADNM